MSTISHPDTIEFAGDYNLSSVVIHNHEGEGVTQEKRGHDIKHLVQELNIYESIYKNAVTGSLVITDTTNLINNLPIQGTETLSFKISTPGASRQDHIIDATQKTGHPFHIYKLSDKTQLNEGLLAYTLHFGSREFVRNVRTRVSKAYSGRFDQMISSIFGDKRYLDSRKQLNFQKTRNQDKIVIPNLHPFAAINMLCTKALADDSKSAGYHFYETTKGFHFRSFESLLITSNQQRRKAKQVFRYVPQNIIDTALENTSDVSETSPLQGNEKIMYNLQSVESYKFLNNFHDTTLNTLMGTYGQRVLTHNIYDKSYSVADYDYHKYFNDTFHTDGKSNPAVVETPVDYDNLSIGEYPESRLSVQPSTRFLHNEDNGIFGTNTEDDGITEAARVSQLNQVMNGTRLQLTVKGQTYIEAGDVIEFQLRGIDNKNKEGLPDPQYAGRYVITKIRHKVTTDDYKMILECTKDSVFNSFASQNLKIYPNTASREQAHFQDINQYDDIASTGAKKGFTTGL